MSKLTDLNTPPNDWKNGFTAPQSPKTDEVPFRIGCQWFLYCWETQANGKKDEVVYSFASDMFLAYNAFHEWLEAQKVKRAV